MVWFDILILIISIYCIIKGYRTGFVKQLASLTGLVVGAILSGKISEIILPKIPKSLNIPESILTPLTYVLAFTLIIFVFYLIGTLIESILKTAKMGKLNRLVGVIFCLTKYYFAVSLILNLLLMLNSKLHFYNTETIESCKTYAYIQPISPLIIPILNEKFLN